MSSLRNLVKVRTYRERSQPKARQKLGLLEKHKDYVLRARDYNKKQAALKTLKEKAAFKNPDEFYFGMVHTKMKNGVHMKRTEAGPSAEELDGFKREDVGYLNMKRSTEMKKIERLQGSLHQLSEQPRNKRTIFVSDAEEAKTVDLEQQATGAAGLAVPKEHEETAPAPEEGASGGGRRRRRGRRGGAERGGVEVETVAKLSAKVQRAQDARYKELHQRRERVKKMEGRIQKLTLERALKGKGSRKKMNGKEGGPRVFKWRQERKR